MSTATTDDLMAALYDTARACDVCTERLATRGGSGPYARFWRVCDRPECAARFRSTALWVDLPNATAFRAVNAWREAKR